ncbi:MAG: hypothetical protein JWN74_1236 [Acidobacteriaceae bacterium]|nr:hypothetical protein [Acidobacteriaceae bacterium]
MNSSEMMQKINGICERHGIKIEFKAGTNCANRREKKVWIKELADSGDFAVALHEIGHAMCDPDKEPASRSELLDAETSAWKWALDSNNNNFDAEGWKRLHESLYQYYSGVMDTSHPAHQLLMRAEEQNDAIRPRVSSYFTGTIKFGGKRNTSPKK